MSKNKVHPQSMTAYAATLFEDNEKSFKIHLKSVNHKFFDFKWRVHRSWFPLEIKIKALLKEHFRRGSFELWSEEIKTTQGNNSEEKLHLYFQELNSTLEKLSKNNYPHLSKESLRSIALEKDDYWWNTKQQNELSEEKLIQAIEVLCVDFQKERNEEGLKTIQALDSHYESLEQALLKCIQLLPQINQKMKEKYEQKISELFQESHDDIQLEKRLQAETLYLLEKKDVSEEVDRIRIHLEKLKKLLQETPVNLGKKLDFLAQELNREWTTLGNKSHHTAIFEQLSEAKLAIDKIREQSMNLA